MSKEASKRLKGRETLIKLPFIVSTHVGWLLFSLKWQRLSTEAIHPPVPEVQTFGRRKLCQKVRGKSPWAGRKNLSTLTQGGKVVFSGLEGRLRPGLREISLSCALIRLPLPEYLSVSQSLVSPASPDP